MCSPGDLQQHPPFLEAESRPLPFLFLTCCVLWPKVHSRAFHASKINPFRDHTLPSYPRFAPWERSFPPAPIPSGWKCWGSPSQKYEPFGSFHKRGLTWPDVCSPPILPLLSFIPRDGHGPSSVAGSYRNLYQLCKPLLFLLYQPFLNFEVPLSPSIPKFPSSPLQDFKLFPWSVSRWKFLPPCEPALLRRALKFSSHLPSVVLFSLSLWQGLRWEPGKEGGGKKVSRKSRAARMGEPDWSRREQSETRDSCFVWVYFGYGFSVWVCFQR